MNIGTLSTLIAVLDRGSFAAAAGEVGLTASAVSLQVKQLEAWFGRPLFDRSARNVHPTAFAREVETIARDVTQRLQALRTQRGPVVAGRVRLGAIATVQTDALPQALRLLQRRHAELDVRVSLDDSEALLAALKAGTLDVAVLVRPKHGGSTRLGWRNVYRQAFVMLAPAGVPRATPRELLRETRLIRYDTSLTGGRIAAAYVRRICPEARFAMEVRSIDAIVAMVSAGLGVSVVPRPRKALLDAHAVREVLLGRGAPTRQIAVVRRAADADSRNVDAVEQAFATVYGEREAA